MSLTAALTYIVTLINAEHFIVIISQLLGHLLQVARRVAANENLDEGYRVGESLTIHFFSIFR